MDRHASDVTQSASSQPHAASLEHSFSQAVAIMARLRAPGGCPWDREQTFDSIRKYTLEETCEVLDAIERHDWLGLKDELGDLLLQVLFYAEMAQEAGYFRLQEVIENLNAKLIRRHPHVFGNVEAETSQQVIRNWEQIKQSERAQGSDARPASMLDSIPRSFPALMEAAKLGSKAASVGFDWPDAAPVFDKLDEELAELQDAIANGSAQHQQSEMGDVLFTLVNLSRKLGIHAETALRSTNAKFRRRFQAMEQAASPRALDQCTPEELEELWRGAKAGEEGSAAAMEDGSSSQ